MLSHKYNCKCSGCRLPKHKYSSREVMPLKNPVKFHRIESKIRLYNDVAGLYGSDSPLLNKVLAIKI